MQSVLDYDAVLVLGFGGPEQPDDVMPFLERVTAGRNVPRERLASVAEHYYHLGGKSPINDQCRALIAALRSELDQHQIALPIYWGNRNWHPLLEDTLRTMQRDGVKRALVYVTSAFSSYSGCRQYLEDMEKARASVGADAPELDKLRIFYNHPGFVDAVTDRVREALEQVPDAQREGARFVFTAHSIPLAMATGCDYVAQLREIATVVATRFGRQDSDVVYQSRSGPPQVPWLEPDICDHLRALATRGDVRDVVVIPLGFVSDHMEVIWDLDHEAKDVAAELRLGFYRAGTAGEHPAFLAMIRELIEERLGRVSTRRTYAGAARPDRCAPGCCAYSSGRPARPG